MIGRNNLVKKPEINEYPLTVGQKGLWFLHQMDPLSDRYHMPLTFKFSNNVNLSELENILSIFIQRHVVLTSTFHQLDGVPIACLHPGRTIKIAEHTINASSQMEWQHQIRQLSAKPFDLEQGPLIRATLLHGHEEGRILLLSIHHLVFDGGSLKVLCNEFESIYQTLNTTDAVVQSEYDYTAFQLWQQQWLNSDDAQSSRKYWLQKLIGQLPQLDIAVDHTSNKNDSIQGELIKFLIPKSVVLHFREFARASKCSEYLVWFTAYFCFLSRYTSQQDIIIGTPSMGRPDSKFDATVGYFVNLIPMRCQLKPQENFMEILQYFKNDIYEALMHADYPLPELINDRGDSLQRGDQPLFQTSFIWTMVEHLKSSSDSKMELEVFPIVHESGEQNISLEILASDSEMHGLIKYRTNCFTAESITRIKDSFINFVTNIGLEPDCELQELPLVNEEQENHLMHVLNNNQADYSLDLCIHQLFEKQVQNNPDACALRFADQSMSYAQMNKRSNQLAHHLLEQGVRPDTIIGLCVDRSFEMLISLLAILKSGGAYLPIDPSYPAARIQHMIIDSQISTIITQEKFSQLIATSGCVQLIIDNENLQQTLSMQTSDNPTIAGLTSNHLAYVIYTSGSTGKPKGVLQRHKTLINLVQAQVKHGGLSDALTTLQFAPVSFDVSIQEIATAWFTASPLIMISDEEKKQLNKLPQLLRLYKIQRAFLPPAVLNWLTETLNNQGTVLPDLQEIIVAGEALHISNQLKNYMQVNQHCQLWNHYGPTETHVVTIAKVDVCDESLAQSIGLLLPNTSALILDSQQQLVPFGAVGELYIGGVSLAKGYLNQQQLSNERFIQHPYSYDDNDMVYRTGDLVRYLHNNHLEFIGRMDDQVKIRGFRIELGEIEQQLSDIKQVQSSVAIVHESAEKQKRIIAYITQIDNDKSIEKNKLITKLYSHLQTALPDYMIPSQIIVVNQFELTANGKIDHTALPIPENNLNNRKYISPEGKTEQLLVNIWSELLEIKKDKISATAHFFELGGHSLLVAKLINEVSHQIHIEISYKDIFNFPLLRDMSNKIENSIKLKSLVHTLDQSTEESIDELEW